MIEDTYTEDLADTLAVRGATSGAPLLGLTQ